MIDVPMPRRLRGDRGRHRLALPLLGAAVVLGVAGGVLVRALNHAPARAAPALPAFHGQAVWGVGERPAPPFALRDQDGKQVSLRSLRGRPVLLTFLDSQCRSSCPIEGRQLGAVLRALPASARPALVVISVDQAGDTTRGIDHALREWRLRGAWDVHWLNAPTRAALATVWKEYGVQVVPTTNDVVHSLALYLIDRRGYERTAYLFPFLPGFVQRDLGKLART